ncbi:MAG: carbohydrate ABC transporter permease [Alicyclobacillus sp.]|nr:carbohydrate ABC transporter permease [Alicyclobacillus sp.]
MIQSTRQRVVGYAVLILLLIVILLPFYWMLMTSFKPTGEIAAYPPTLLPNHWTVAHYGTVFSQYHFQVYIRNSVIVSVASTFLVLLFASMAGFSIAKLSVRGKVPILVGLLVISMFPPIAMVTTLYVFLRALHWLDSYQALIIPYTAFNLPFSVWLLRNYFLQVPGELLEASKIDGAGVYQTYFRVFLPLTTPGLFAASVFTFVACWTEFFMALVLNPSDQMRTIPVGIALFAGQYNMPFGDIFAGSVVSILPIAVLVLIFRKWIVAGLTAGAIKG